MRKQALAPGPGNAGVERSGAGLVGSDPKLFKYKWMYAGGPGAILALVGRREPVI